MASILDLIFPTTKRLQAELLTMRKESKPMRDELVRWDREEIRLLGHQQIKKKSRKRSSGKNSGIFQSIYQESLLCYQFKEILGFTKSSLLYAATSSNEFYYMIRKNGTEIYIDDAYAGLLNAEGVLSAGRLRKKRAQVVDKGEPALKVYIGGEEVGQLVHPKRTDKYNPRALEFVEKLNPKAELLLLGLTTYYLVQFNR